MRWVFVKFTKAMAWRFDNNRLIAPDGLSWPARSGPYGCGKLPAGKYIIKRPVVIKSEAAKFNSYRDKTGFAWWCRLTPCFKTERTGLGIHPDGNVPGTRGCIGITLDDTRPVFEALRNCEDKMLIVFDNSLIT